MSVGYQSIEIDSFDPSIYSEVVADAHFEQRLLKGGRFSAQLRRVSLPRSRLDCGRYSLPCLGRGAMPDGWMNVGFTLRDGEPAWVNGLHLHADDIQVYAEGTPIEYRCVPDATWFAFQVRREELQTQSLAVNGSELSLPEHGMQNCRLSPAAAARIHGCYGRLMRFGDKNLRSLPVDLHLASLLEEQLLTEVVLAIRASVIHKDGRTERAVERRLAILNAGKNYLSHHLAASFSMRELAAATRTSERSLEYLFHDAYGVSPRNWFLIARLHRVRQELLTAVGDRVSIRALANRWGFGHGGRFAAAYERLFEESPRETLSDRRYTQWRRARSHEVSGCHSL